MIYPLLPAFLTGTLRAGPAFLGVVEGLAEAVAAFLKLAAGRLADRLPRRKPLVVAGYGLSSLVRPLVALATAAGHVLVIRLLDRVGKGVRGAPRDALLADVTAEDQRGRAYGFHRAMDHAGAMVGPLLASAALLFTPDLRIVFAPGRDPRGPGHGRSRLRRARGAAALAAGRRGSGGSGSGRPGAASLFMGAGRLHPGQLQRRLPAPARPGGGRGPPGHPPALGLPPPGQVGRQHVGRLPLRPRWAVARRSWRAGRSTRFAYAGFARLGTQAEAFLLFALYGLFHALTEGPERALVADLAGPEAQGPRLRALPRRHRRHAPARQPPHRRPLAAIRAGSGARNGCGAGRRRRGRAPAFRPRAPPRGLNLGAGRLSLPAMATTTPPAAHRPPSTSRSASGSFPRTRSGSRRS